MIKSATPNDNLHFLPDVIEALLKLDLEEAGHPVLHRRPEVLVAGDPLGPGEVLEPQLGNVHELCHAGLQFGPDTQSIIIKDGFKVINFSVCKIKRLEFIVLVDKLLYLHTLNLSF